MDDDAVDKSYGASLWRHILVEAWRYGEAEEEEGELFTSKPTEGFKQPRTP